MVGNALSRTSRQDRQRSDGVLGFGLAWAVTPGMPVLGRRRPARGEGAGAWSCSSTSGGSTTHRQGGRAGAGLQRQVVRRPATSRGAWAAAAPSSTTSSRSSCCRAKDRPDAQGWADPRVRRREQVHRESSARSRTFFPIVPRVREGRGGLPDPDPRLRPDPDRERQLHRPLRRGLGRPALGQDDLSARVAEVGRAQDRPRARGEFEGIMPGRPRVLPDGRVGKFGWKAQFASLEEFVAAACANEIGLGNPKMEQAQPIGHRLPGGRRPTSTAKQFRDLVAFVDTLPRPVEIAAGRPGRGRAGRAGQGAVREGRLRLVPHARPGRGGGGLQRLPAPPARRPRAGAARATGPPRRPRSRCPTPSPCPRSGRPRRSGAWPTPPPTSTTAARRPSKPRSPATTATPRPCSRRINRLSITSERRSSPSSRPSGPRPKPSPPDSNLGGSLASAR